ncbi:MAG: Transcriptional regulatory protein AfsQ1 [Candidatus Aminicenantes bacterium ADurb.Bin147]|nr:MAG: Transcriptional regulatory protein AfsQ1 [Candidatus Aminicenantes bacterium ADurb.Bin147]
MTEAAGRPLILIVEDEIIIAMEIQVRLESAGFAVCGLASSGEKAIALAREKNPDLVLMDITLKGPLDGLETAGRIQAEKDIPVIFLSATDDEAVLRASASVSPSRSRNPT